MGRKDLKNKPLVEAILDLRWALPEQQGSGRQGDPHYRLLLGRFSERAEKDYPFHEALPTSRVPDEIVAHMPQHRFRIGEGNWPLIQIGPGIMTVNDTSGYTWLDFQQRCEAAVQYLFDAHPMVSDLRIQELTLRYIDAVAFDFATNSILDFLSDKMKVKLSLPESLFADTHVKRNPSAFNWQVSFIHDKPGGTVTLRFGTGQRDELPSLVWETLVESASDQLPALPQDFPKWLDEAHEITDDWFFKLIEGELERRFSGE